MAKSNLPKGIRAYIRKEKANIRRLHQDPEARKAARISLYARLKLSYPQKKEGHAK